MRLLNEILQLRRDIDSIAERAIELKQMTQPKAQTISDMPRGGGERKNAIEEYIIKSERLHRKFVHKKELFFAKWSEFRRIADDCGVTGAQRDVIYYRFHDALPWKLCVARMENNTRKRHGMNRNCSVYIEKCCAKSTEKAKRNRKVCQL